jgi:hypothetical protein
MAPMTATLDPLMLEVIRDALSAVRAESQEELVSMRSVRDDYGFVLRDDLSVDHAATERARNALRSKLGNAKQRATE